MRDLMRMAERILDQPQGASTSQPALQRQSEEDDEVIDASESVTYILHAPGYTQDQLRISVQRDEIEVKTPDFMRRRRLTAQVDPDTVESKYLNGVLSVRVKKA